MGEMADFELEGHEDEYEHYMRYKDSDPGIQYDEGLVDEYGNAIGNPSSIPTKEPTPS